MRKLMIAVGVLVAGCTASTGIIPAGPDTYALTVKVSPISGGSMTAQPKAIAQGAAYCESQGRTFVPVQMNETAPRAEVGSTGYAIVFRCAAK